MHQHEDMLQPIHNTTNLIQPCGTLDECSQNRARVVESKPALEHEPFHSSRNTLMLNGLG